MITRLLVKRDLLSLRLACKEIAAKVSHGLFRTFFTRKRLDLTINSVELFISLTASPEGPGCLLQHLVLVGCTAKRNPPYSNTLSPTACISTRNGAPARRSHDIMHARDIVHSVLLSIAFRQLRENSRSRRLHSLSLEVDQGRFPETWPVASGIFRTTFTALVNSGLLVNSFNVFGDVQQCCIGFDDLIVCHNSGADEFSETSDLRAGGSRRNRLSSAGPEDAVFSEVNSLNLQKLRSLENIPLLNISISHSVSRI